MDRENGDSEEEDQIDGDRGLVHAAATSCEEYVHDNGHGDASEVHGQRAADEDTPPHAGIGLFNLLDTVFGECVRQIHQ